MTAEVNTQAQVPEQKSDKEINFEKLRKQLEQERAEKLEFQRRYEEMERKNIKAPPAPSYDDDEDDNDEPYLDHKSFKKKMASWERKMEDTIDKKAEQKARLLLEQEKQQSYIKQNPDFSSILTPENIERFANEHPAIAERMLRMPDNFDRQALLYEQIKALKGKEEAKPSIQEKINENRKSPYYQPTGIGTAPYSAGGDFSKTGQKSAYEKMQELKSRLRI